MADEVDKIRIRMPNGKIYGPYDRDDVLRFIRLKRVRGEEEMLLLSEGRWKPVSSDPEFFDAIQDALDGSSVRDFKERKKKKARKEKDPDTKVDKVDDGLDSGDEERTVATGSEREGETALSSMTRTFKPFKEDLSNWGKTGTESEDKQGEGTQAEAGQAPRKARTGGKKAPEKKVAKASSRGLYLIAGVLLVLIILVLGMEDSKRVPIRSVDGVPIKNSLRYFRSLAWYVETFKFSWPRPEGQIKRQEDFPLSGGFGVHHWLLEMKQLEREEILRGGGLYWYAMAWNAKWIARTIELADPVSARVFADYAQDIVTALSEKNAITQTQIKSLSFIDEFSEGRWAKAREIILEASDNSYARWLHSMASYLEFIDRGSLSADSVEMDKTGIATLDLSVETRERLVEADDSLMFSAEQLLEFDPQSYDALMSLSQHFWKHHTSGIPRAQQAFISLLSVGSLYPKSMQALIWKEYAGLQAAFGREQSSQSAINNFQQLFSGNVIGSEETAFWDIESEDLSAVNVANLIVKRMERKASNLVDIAHLENASYTLEDPAENFLHVIYYSIFYEDWERAERLSRFILEKEKANVDALGSLVWVKSSNYRFDEAFEYLERITKSPLNQGDAQKYTGLLYMFARDYPTALAEIQNYLKLRPNDGMGHYFLAMTHERMEKNHDCVKASNLGRIHGRGAVRFLSELLFYRCRVMAKLAVDQALRELKRATEADPHNVFLIEEYVFALRQAGLMEEAFDEAKAAIKRMPSSYRLKLMLGELFEVDRKWDAALLFYNDARKLRPKSIRATIKIGEMFLKKERYVEAAENFLSAARWDPEYPDLYLFAARAYRKAGRRTQALENYKRELDLRPAVMRTFLEVAEYLLEAGIPQEVPKLFQMYEDNYQGDPRVLVRLAQSYWAMQDLDNALKMVKLALQKNNKIPEAYRIMGFVYEKNGQYQVAKEAFEKYLLLLPQANDANAIRNKLKYPPFQ